MLHTVSLKENSVFRRLYYKGASAGNRYLVIYCRRNGSKFSRLGLTVSTKLGKAVVRNRMRRRLREVYRLQEKRLLSGFDIVVVARSAAVDADFPKLQSAFRHAADKLGLLLQE
ncbi:MAG: ribonuclease P protein component [Ruminococcaceae bacterium]|nr:ribonuclease P protein component [Oscillospiraceae bacterium]